MGAGAHTGVWGPAPMHLRSKWAQPTTWWYLRTPVRTSVPLVLGLLTYKVGGRTHSLATGRAYAHPPDPRGHARIACGYAAGLRSNAPQAFPFPKNKKSFHLHLHLHLPSPTTNTSTLHTCSVVLCIPHPPCTRRRYVHHAHMMCTSE